VTLEPYRLNKLMNELNKDELSSMLSEFRCSRNKDSEYFLKKIALKHEAKDISRTYLIIDDEMKIRGYYTLALKCLGLQDPDLDPSVIDSMNLKDGIAQAYLIGQLARSDGAEKGLGRKMIAAALERFSEGKEMFGCRMVRLDCKDELIGYYESFGFQLIRKNYEKDLNQMAVFI